MRREGIIVNQIILKPLALNQINQLIADTLNSEKKYVVSLAKLVWQKTNGNPFFVNQFFKSIYSEKLLVFNSYQPSFTQQKNYRECWQWNLKKIKSISSTDNLVKFMIGKMQNLPKSTQDVLSLAACIGAEFDLNTISIISEKSASELFNILTPVIDAGLIIPLSELDEQLLIQDYKFGHDRIQQAAYALIALKQKPFTHLKIGRLLWGNIQPDELLEKIFIIVDHLNLGHQLITHQPERNEIARLNLLAGQKAKAANAHEAALKYLKIGQKLLAEGSWKANYNLTLTLYSEAAEVAYLSGDFEQMEHFSSVVLEKAKILLDRVKIYEVKIQACITHNELLKGIQTAFQVVELLGVELPKQPCQADVIRILEETQQSLKKKPIEEIYELPKMIDPIALAVMRILSRIAAAAYIAFPNLLPLIVCKQLNLSLHYGNTSVSASAYAWYAVILCGITEDIDTGYRFAQLAIYLLSKFNVKEFKASTIMLVNATVIYWKESEWKILEPLLEAYKSGLETGDLEFACFAAHVYCQHSYHLGRELVQLEKEMASYSKAIAQLKQETAFYYNEIFRQSVLNLLGKSDHPHHLIGEAYDELRMLPIHQQAEDRAAIVRLYVNKLILSYLSCINY